MRVFLPLLLLFALPVSSQTNDATAPGQTTNATTETDDPWTAATKNLPSLYQSWKTEHDPAKRADLADKVVQAAMYVDDDNAHAMGDDVVRDGLPKNELAVPATVTTIKLTPLTTLWDAHTNESDFPPTPVFRRISASRFEAWTPHEGWLFDAKGRTVADVKVPRRDGSGREWFGAFLPDGRWITTDIWDNDKQLNAYTPKGDWKWELPGDKIVAALPKPAASDSDEPITPSIGWARADKTGKKWLVCLGTDYTRGLALVSPDGKFQPLPESADVWQLVYPRSLGPRGFYISMSIKSDDGKLAMDREESGHGVGVGWPSFGFPGNKAGKIIHGGNEQFGFWPGAHAIYIEADGEDVTDPHETWFFDAKGQYEGQVTASYLADTVNGRGLLLKDVQDRVLRVEHNEGLVTVPGIQAFIWPDGSVAMPVAVYDDLKLGFFLRGAGIQGSGDDSRRARAKADIVLAKW
ncbi:MAG: hypothetical protein LV479_03890 [Methylacidiphilales bacterium]|nr:hypothetical protein [Candidatus Methylacidiphilales bacterium]